MGNCIHIRENRLPHENKTKNKYIDMRLYIEQQMQLVQERKNQRMKEINKQLERFERGANSSEEEDKVIIDKYDAYDSDDNNNKKNPNSHSQSIMSQQQQQQVQSYDSNDNQGYKTKQNGESESDGESSLNSQDELKEYFGGAMSHKKHILASIINTNVPGAQDENIKKFQNTVFQKEDSDEQNNMGNVFSDNDISFDQSPGQKKQQ